MELIKYTQNLPPSGMGLSLSVQYKKVSEHFTVLVVCGENTE